MVFSNGNIITNLTGEEPARYYECFLLGKLEEPYEQYAEMWGEMLKAYTTKPYNLNHFTVKGCAFIYFKVVDYVYNYPEYALFIEPLSTYTKEKTLVHLCKTGYKLFPYVTDNMINYFTAYHIDKINI